MAIRRRLLAGTPGYTVSTRNFGMPTRTFPNYPRYTRPSSVAYDTKTEDVLLFDRVSQATFLSDALLDEGYDTARRSRGRDQQLLRDATNAIVSSESYATPQTSVATRRVARGRVLRAASVPPRPAPPAYYEVDRSSLTKATTAASTITTKTSNVTLVPSRPIVVYTVRPVYEGRARSVPPPVQKVQTRAVSVPPSVYYGEKTPEEKTLARVVVTWRSASSRWVRASSAPPLRRRRRAVRAAPRLIMDEPPPPPLPTAGLKAHKVPRRFLTRRPFRTPFGSLYGYYEHGRPVGKPNRQERTAAEEQRASIRRLILFNRVLGSPVRVSPAQPRSRVGARARYLLALAPPKPKPMPARQSLIDFPQVYVPSKGPKPSNRAKAAIIASKLEPDPIKRRRPRSQFAADKLRSMRKEAQESVYTATTSAGLTSSTPPLFLQSRRRR